MVYNRRGVQRFPTVRHLLLAQRLEIIVRILNELRERFWPFLQNCLRREEMRWETAITIPLLVVGVSAFGEMDDFAPEHTVLEIQIAIIIVIAEGNT